MKSRTDPPKVDDFSDKTGSVPSTSLTDWLVIANLGPRFKRVVAGRMLYGRVQTFKDSYPVNEATPSFLQANKSAEPHLQRTTGKEGAGENAASS
jgi:hypothetical protein